MNLDESFDLTAEANTKNQNLKRREDYEGHLEHMIEQEKSNAE